MGAFAALKPAFLSALILPFQMCKIVIPHTLIALIASEMQALESSANGRKVPLLCCLDDAAPRFPKTNLN